MSAADHNHIKFVWLRHYVRASGNRVFWRTYNRPTA
jgi:hypothetical protein